METRATFIFYRDTNTANILPAEIFVNGKRIGNCRARQGLKYKTEPGDVELIVQGAERREKPLQIRAEAGETYYFRLQFSMVIFISPL